MDKQQQEEFDRNIRIIERNIKLIVLFGSIAAFNLAVLVIIRVFF